MTKQAKTAKVSGSEQVYNPYNGCKPDIVKDLLMEQNIGATELRHNLTDVLQAVREQGAAYVIETFGRPQAVLIDLGTYRRFQGFQSERAAFFDWLDTTAERNAERNRSLSDEDVLAIIAQARDQVASAAG